MQDFLLLRDSAAIKALAHPLRLQLLEQLIARPASVQQLASQLQQVHAKVFYHVKELEKNRLVEVVGEHVINGITERFYRAAARTFYLGQAVGPFAPAEQTVAQAVQSDLLRQRRQHELQVDNRQVAHDLVYHALRVQPGAKVVLEGANHQADLLEAMLLECRLAGAEAFIRLMNTNHLRQLLLELSVEQLASPPPLTTFLYGHVDLWVSFDAVAETAAFADCDPAKVEAVIQGELRAYKQGPKRFAAVEVGYPTRERATELGVDYGLLHDLFWRAISSPPAELRARGQELRQQVLATATSCDAPLRLASPDGRSNLDFYLDRDHALAQVIINDGTLDPDRVDPRQLVDLSLPGGQLLLTPQAGTLSGHLRVDQYTHRGTAIRDIELQFRHGQLASWSAARGQTTLSTLLATLGSAPLSAAKLSLGCNPKVPTLTGYKLLDPVAQGSLGIQLLSQQGVPLWLYAGNINHNRPR